MKIEKDIRPILELAPQEIDDLLKDLCVTVKVNDSDLHDIRLMLEEAITNAIQHGNECNTGMPVKAILEAEDGTLVMTVTDQGSGFDEQKVENPLEAKEEFKSSGRGVFLIRELADDVTFLDNGSTIKMTKKI